MGDGRFPLTYRTNKKNLDQLEDKLGFRILMTDRHGWSSEAIVSALHGQSTVEQAFKNIKKPYHLAVTPEFHWIDQKIRVHYFSCIIGYLDLVVESDKTPEATKAAEASFLRAAGALVQTKRIFGQHVYAVDIHTHSTFSDGRGTVAQNDQAAKNAGLDFLAMNSRNCYFPLDCL